MSANEKHKCHGGDNSTRKPDCVAWRWRWITDDDGVGPWHLVDSKAVIDLLWKHHGTQIDIEELGVIA